MGSKWTERTRRERALVALDEELEAREQVERDLEDEVNRLWKATRWYLGHEEWTKYKGFDDEDWWGCDCNKYYRFALLKAIGKLRAWRERGEWWG